MKSFLKRNTAWISLLLMVVIFGALTEWSFLSPRNVTNLIRQATINGVLACGMTLVILTGGIDLSVGSLVALAGMGVGISQTQWGWGDAGALGVAKSALLALSMGTVAGALSGSAIAWFKIPPFVITLGMMVIARGLALITTEGNGISPMGETLQQVGESYFEGVGVLLGLLTLIVPLLLPLLLKQESSSRRSRLADLFFPALALGVIGYAFSQYKGLPVFSVLLIAVFLGTAFLLQRTTLGRSIFAVGSNESAAFWAGVPVERVKLAVYLINGALAGLAGWLLSARLNSAVPTAGNLFELDAIAAVVIGGTSLKGGVGSVVGSVVGALTIATLNNGLDLLGVSSFYQMILKGIIIIGAVALDRSDEN